PGWIVVRWRVLGAIAPLSPQGSLWPVQPARGYPRIVAQGWKRPLQLAAACWVAFAILLVVAYWVPFARWADGWAVAGFVHLQRPWLNSAAHHIAGLANFWPFALWTILIAGVALYRHRPREAAAAVALMTIAPALAEHLKMLLAHDRHHAFLGKVQIDAASFPSGHATASMALAFAAVLVAPVAWRPLVAIAGAVFALAVSESVLLLDFHFPSDVAAGFIVAIACGLTAVAGLRAANERWPARTGREAARRAITEVDPRRIAAIFAGFIGASLAVVLVLAGEHAVHFADHHTTAV